MRNRHVARVCTQCEAPMASGAATCWRCGVEWASEDQPPTTLRLVPSEPPQPRDPPFETVAFRVGATERAEITAAVAPA